MSHNLRLTTIIILLAIFQLHCGEEKIEPMENNNPEALFKVKSQNKGFVVFENLSKNASNFHWDLGDSTVSDERAPSHQYQENKTYEVVLTAKSGTLEHQVSITVIIDDIPASMKQIADFPGEARSQTIYFHTNDKFYVGLGEDDDHHLLTDLWEYDLPTQTWTQKNDGPGYKDASSFLIGNKVYVGIGYGGGSTANEFWEYDILSDAWKRLADFPGENERGATGFSIDGKGYIVNGRVAFTGEKEFWRYTPASDSWEQLGDFPGNPRHQSAHFVLNDKAYICAGSSHLGGSNSTFYNDLWEYDANSDTWTEKAKLPASGRVGATAFTIQGKGYIGFGHNSSSDLNDGSPATEYFNDIWEYDPVSNSWAEITPLPDIIRAYPFVMETLDFVWIGTGRAGTYKLNSKDIWEFKIN